MNTFPHLRNSAKDIELEAQKLSFNIREHYQEDRSQKTKKVKRDVAWWNQRKETTYKAKLR